MKQTPHIVKVIMDKLIKFWLVTLSLCVAIATKAQAAEAALDAAEILKRVKVSSDFKVTVFAAPPDVGYPTCLAAAPAGELFVGVDENGSIDAKEGRGRVVRCVDTDGDGRADKVTTFAQMDSPRGIWFDHNTLYVMHPPLITAFIDENHDGVADRSEVLVKGLGFDLKFRGADHTVNGMRIGIDGWLYIAVGDYGAIRAEGKDGATLQLHGGGVVRVRPDGTGLELVTDGQRNIYDVAVSPLLDLFTRDNTNDGDGWNVRLSQIIHGGHYGYPSLYQHFSDEIIAPLADYGGGSPCGSLYMDEPGFPKGIGSALFTCDWGRSIVYRHPLERVGAGFKAEQETFVEIPRPTDMDVDGQGRIYIASWENGGFTYSGPNVGYVIQVTPKEHKPDPAPNLAKASSEQLVKYLESPSSVWRLHTQREILRRGQRLEVSSGLIRLAQSSTSLPVRVAAVFTLKQLLGTEANAALVELAKIEELKEYALRALADNKRDNVQAPIKPFVDALSDANPRVRLQAVTGLHRLARVETASALLPLTSDQDPLVSHAAINALIAMKASDACLTAIQSPAGKPYVAGAVRVLQALHEPAIADGLITSLGTTQESTARQAILKGLCRLYQREADWDGKWWGTRPDSSGPYFKPVKWEASDRIANALRQELNTVSGEQLRWFAVELQKNKVDLPELPGIVLNLASKDASFRPVALNLLASRASELSNDSIAFLREVAISKETAINDRARAIRTLQRGAKTPEATDAAIAGLAASGLKLEGELGNAWEQFARDPQQARYLTRYEALARSNDPAERLLGYGVFVNLANHRSSAPETKTIAARAIDSAWKRPEAVLSLMEAIARLRAEQYGLQVRAYLEDARPEVKEAAEKAAERLGLNRSRRRNADEPLIETQKYDDVIAVVLKEKGNAEAGARVFSRAGCAACHTVEYNESPKGPYLGDIASRYSRTELCESILKPSAKIAQGFETQWFKTKDDEEYEGFVTREGGEDLDLRNIAGITTNISKKDVAERSKREASIMPAGLLDKFSSNELASLLAYLESKATTPNLKSSD